MVIRFAHDWFVTAQGMCQPQSVTSSGKPCVKASGGMAMLASDMMPVGTPEVMIEGEMDDEMELEMEGAMDGVNVTRNGERLWNGYTSGEVDEVVTAM